MGLRNALRRKTQTAVVVAGLMVGTAIISGSLASGDSLQFGIQKATYDALGPTDILLETDGQLHYPRALYDDLAANQSLRAAGLRALSPILFEEAAATAPATKQSEPRVSVIGFDPTLNAPFGTFRSASGGILDGRDLGASDAYVLDDLAKKLDAHVGDTIALHYQQPLTPRIPKLYQFNGSLTAGAGVCPLPQVPQACQYVAPPGENATFSLPVGAGAVGITTIVAWFGQTAQTTDLDQTLSGPGGAFYANSNGTPAQPDNPSVLNVTSDKPLAPGNWTWSIGAKIAANQPFRAIALVFYEEYNLTALQQFAAQAQSAGFDSSQVQQLAGGAGGEGGQTANVTIRAIVTKDGFGGFLRGENVYMREDAVANLYGQDGKVDLILASASADPTQGAARSVALMKALPKAVNASADQHPDMPAIRAVNALAIKQRLLDASERAGTLFKEFLTTIGSFTVIAGIMLIVNIFVMLAEERKSELGMARAVGLARRQLIYLFGFEGALYALAASTIGALLGLGLAFGLILGFNAAFASGPQESTRVLSIPFHVQPSSLLWAFAAGFLITLLTVAVASWRVSRLNIVRAIRRIEEPPRPASRALTWLGVTLLAAGAAWALVGFITGDFPSKILAPCVALMGGGIVLSRVVPGRIAYPLAGAGVAAYAGYTIFTFGNPKGLLNAVMGPIRGLFIVLAVVLILIHIPQLVRATSWLLLRFKRLTPAVRPGVAYPLGKKTRTGLTTTMFALVVLVVFAFSIFGATFSVDATAQSGGYEVEGDTTVPISDLEATYHQQADPNAPDPFRNVQYHDDLRYAEIFGGTAVKINGEKVNYQGPPVDDIYAYTESFAKNNRYDFVALDPAYKDAQAAYEALLSDPKLVIVSVAYNFDDQGNPGVHHVGDTLTLKTPSGEASFRIIGFQKQLYLGGLWVNPKVLESSFQRVRGEYLFKLKPAVDPVVAAREIEAAFDKQGMHAVSIQQAAQQQQQEAKRFLTLFQLFLGFGLVVGIASLGIVTARNVIERRQEIGMLRAIGYPRKQILRIFFIEIFFTTTLGIVVGGAIGIITSYGVVQSTPALAQLGVTFKVPVLDLAEIVALIYVAVFLATYWPARQGSRVPPAEAVRYIE